VTTERNDTLQLGAGHGVVQVQFERTSPLRWQTAIVQLLGWADRAGDPTSASQPW
jgi:hypothetical protein